MEKCKGVTLIRTKGTGERLILHCPSCEDAAKEIASLRDLVNRFLNDPPARMSGPHGKIYPINSTGMRTVIDELSAALKKIADLETPITRQCYFCDAIVPNRPFQFCQCQLAPLS